MFINDLIRMLRESGYGFCFYNINFSASTVADDMVWFHSPFFENSSKTSGHFLLTQPRFHPCPPYLQVSGKSDQN